MKEPGKFPGMPRPAMPFGKRVPLPGKLPVVMPRVAFPLGRMAGRLFPWLGLGLLAWELWMLYQNYAPPEDMNGCRAIKPDRRQYYGYLPYDFCFSDSGVLDLMQPVWSPGYNAWYIVQPNNDPPNPNRQESVSFKVLNPAEFHPVPGRDFTPPPGETIPYLPPQPMFPVVPWVPIAVPPLSPQPLPIPRPPFVPEYPNPEQPPGPVVIPPPRPGLEPNPQPVPWSPPHTGFPSDPDAEAGPGKRPRPGRRPRPEPTPQPEPFPARRPGRGKKERKLRGTAGQRRLLGWLLSAASEAGDLLEALHDALPKDFQGKDHPKSMFEALYKHWDKVNMDEAFANIWNNQVEDKYFGEFFKAFQDAASEAGLDFPSLRDVGGNFGQFR